MNRVRSSALVALFAVSSVFCAAAEMTYDQYLTGLAGYQLREKTAKEQIATEQAAIESIKQQIADVEGRISAVILETYSILGISEVDVADAQNEIAAIRSGLSSLAYLSGSELFARQSELSALENRTASLRSRPVAKLWKIRDQLNEVADQAARIRGNMPTSDPAAPLVQSLPSYTVQENPEKRDCLWRIAEKSEVFSDPAQWTKIYRANKSEIDRSFERYMKKNPNSKYTRPEDLLFPGQSLDIPR